MIVHPTIAALREDPLSQRRTRQNMTQRLTDWQQAEKISAIAGELAEFGRGAPLQACPMLENLLRDLSVADSFVNQWTQTWTTALGKNPLGEVPHRFRVSEGLATLQLLNAGRATLSIMAYYPLEVTSEPRSVAFSDRETHEIVLSGSAKGIEHRRPSGTVKTGRLVNRARCCSAGDIITCIGDHEARQFTDVVGSMVLLQLSRTPERPDPTRVYSLDDGRLIQSISGDKCASQNVMALAVLGALGETRALAAMQDRALDRAEDADVRWEAVRQALAMDARCGFALLGKISKATEDMLSKPASALHRQLLHQAQSEAA